MTRRRWIAAILVILAMCGVIALIFSDTRFSITYSEPRK